MTIYNDIITIVKNKQPVAVSDVCEELDKLGYGGAKSWNDFRADISKKLFYLKKGGTLTNEKVKVFGEGNKIATLWSAVTDKNLETYEIGPGVITNSGTITNEGEATTIKAVPAEVLRPSPEVSATLLRTLVKAEQKIPKEQRKLRKKVTIQEALEAYWEADVCNLDSLEVWFKAILFMENR